jgi:hypothetical protein
MIEMYKIIFKMFKIGIKGWKCLICLHACLLVRLVQAMKRDWSAFFFSPFYPLGTKGGGVTKHGVCVPTNMTLLNLR